MQFNVSQLLMATPGEERRYSFQEQAHRYEELAEEVRGDVRLMRTDRGVLVMGEVNTAVTCECSRCLAQFRLPVAFEIADEYLPRIDVNTGLPVAKGEDYDESLVIDEHHILDLGETIRQYAVLNVPMKPLCREGCKGFCPTCGVDRNRQQCSCPTGQADQRWAKLASLDALRR